MANHDIKADTTPANSNMPPWKPTVAALRTALSTFNATTFSADRLNAMSKNDMIYAARVSGLTVDGL